MKAEAERIRIRYLYRRMILSGEIEVHRHTAKRLIGPDCAYHLYGRLTEPKDQRPSPSAKASGDKKPKGKAKLTVGGGKEK